MPKWVDSSNEGWDITAKAEGDSPLTVEQFRELLRAVLTDRFKIKVHKVVEERPAYALVVDKEGSKLKESAPGTRRTEKQVDGSLEGTHYDTARLANRLAGELDQRVVDLTGLKGFYDLKLQWTPDHGAAAGSAEPSLFTAVRMQLGLKLEVRKKYPVEFIVVDHVEKPDTN